MILCLFTFFIVVISFIVVIIVKGDTKLGHQSRSHEVVMVYIAEDVMNYTGFTTPHVQKQRDYIITAPENDSHRRCTLRQEQTEKEETNDKKLLLLLRKS